MKNSNKGLNHDEPILFEIGDMDKSGVDLNEPTFKENFIGECFAAACLPFCKIREKWKMGSLVKNRFYFKNVTNSYTCRWFSNSLTANI